MIARILFALLCALPLPFLKACNFADTGGGGTGVEGLSGSLVDAQGAPVAGALVRLYPQAGAVLAKAARGAVAADSVTSRADGSFRFPNPPAGRYNLEASVQRRDTTFAVFVRGIKYARELQRGQDTLRTTGSLSLQVLSEGQPVAGARCFVPASPYEAESDAAGTCLLTNVAPGSYEVGVSRPGEKATYTDLLEVTSGATTEGTAVLKAPGSGGAPERGATWTARTTGTTVSLNGIHWSENQFTVVGNSGTVLLSENALNWRQESTGMANNLGRVVIRTSSGLLCTASEGAVFHSPTGVTWARTASGGIGAMAWDGSTLVLMSGGGFIRTAAPDGTGWTTIRSGADPANPGITPDYLQVIWTGSLWIAVGRAASDSAGLIYTASHWSESWTLRHHGAPATSLTYVVQAGGKIYAGGPGGLLLTSVDGVAWTEAPTAPDLRTLRWVGDRLVGVGQGSDGTAGIWTSTDGSQWKRRHTGPPNSYMQSLAVSDSLIVAVGSHGTILTSP